MTAKRTQGAGSQVLGEMEDAASNPCYLNGLVQDIFYNAADLKRLDLANDPARVADIKSDLVVICTNNGTPVAVGPTAG